MDRKRIEVRTKAHDHFSGIGKTEWARVFGGEKSTFLKPVGFESDEEEICGDTSWHSRPTAQYKWIDPPTTVIENASFFGEKRKLF